MSRGHKLWTMLFEVAHEGCKSARPSLVSKWNGRNISKSLFGPVHPIKFLLMKTDVCLEEEVVCRI